MASLYIVCIYYMSLLIYLYILKIWIFINYWNNVIFCAPGNRRSKRLYSLIRRMTTLIITIYEYNNRERTELFGAPSRRHYCLPNYNATLITFPVEFSIVNLGKVLFLNVNSYLIICSEIWYKTNRKMRIRR